MRCVECTKLLQLDESRHTGLCYECRKPEWAKATQPRAQDPMELIDRLYALLADQKRMNHETTILLASLRISIERTKQENK